MQAEKILICRIRHDKATTESPNNIKKENYIGTSTSFLSELKLVRIAAVEFDNDAYTGSMEKYVCRKQKALVC